MAGEDDLEIALGARVKDPGEAMVGRLRELSLVHDAGEDAMGPYERLLGDAMEGDATLFAREDAVERAWEIVQPILGVATPVHEYEPGSWGPAQAERLATDVGGWHCPTSAP